MKVSELISVLTNFAATAPQDIDVHVNVGIHTFPIRSIRLETWNDGEAFLVLEDEEWDDEDFSDANEQDVMKAQRIWPVNQEKKDDA